MANLETLSFRITKLLLFSLMSLCNSLQGQTVSDSLHSVWQDVEYSDSLRTDAYSNYITLNYLNSNTDSALILIENLLDFTKTKNYQHGIVSALSLKSKAYRIKTNYPISLNYLKECLDIANEINDAKIIAQTQSDIGVIYYFQKEYDRALKYFKLSRDMRKANNDPEGESLSLNNMGLIYKEKKLWQRTLLS